MSSTGQHGAQALATGGSRPSAYPVSEPPLSAVDGPHDDPFAGSIGAGLHRRLQAANTSNKRPDPLITERQDLIEQRATLGCHGGVTLADPASTKLTHYRPVAPGGGPCAPSEWRHGMASSCCGRDQDPRCCIVRRENRPITASTTLVAHLQRRRLHSASS